MKIDKEIRSIFEDSYPEEFVPCWTSETFKRQESLIYGLREMARVTLTLILRETRTRYGRHKLGYLWAFLEPSMHIALFCVIFYFRNREILFGMSMLLFLTTGVIPYFTFFKTYNQVSNGIKINKALMSHTTITSFSIALARSILELLTLIILLIFILYICFSYFDDYYVENYLWIVFSMFGAAAMGLGLGLAVSALSSIFESLKTVVSSMTRLLYFTSGVFYSIQIFPPKIQDYMLLNPLLHIIDNIRSNLSPVYSGGKIDMMYASYWIIGLLFVGLMLDLVLQKKMLAR